MKIVEFSHHEEKSIKFKVELVLKEDSQNFLYFNSILKLPFQHHPVSFQFAIFISHSRVIITSTNR